MVLTSVYHVNKGESMGKKKKEDTIEDIIDRIDNDMIALRDKVEDLQNQLTEQEIDDEDEDFEDEDEE